MFDLITALELITTTDWLRMFLLPAFVGMSKPLGPLPFTAPFSAYVLFVTAVLITFVFFIPLLARDKPVQVTQST